MPIKYDNSILYRAESEPQKSMELANAVRQQLMIVYDTLQTEITLASRKEQKLIRYLYECFKEQAPKYNRLFSPQLSPLKMDYRRHNEKTALLWTVFTLEMASLKKHHPQYIFPLALLQVVKPLNMALLNLRCHASRDTALSSAVKLGCTNDALLLLTVEGVDGELKNSQNNTPLILAAHNGYLQIVKKITAKGVNLEAKNIHGNTALMIASLEGKDLVVQHLLKVGANINAKNEYGSTAFSYASKFKHLSVLKILLKHDNLITPKELFMVNKANFALKLAIIEEDRVMTEILLAHGAQSQKSLEGEPTALFLAMRSNLQGVAERLKITNENPKYLLFLAVDRLEEKCFENLLKENTDLANATLDGAKEGISILSYAVTFGTTKMVDVLLAIGATITIGDLITARRKKHNKRNKIFKPHTLSMPPSPQLKNFHPNEKLTPILFDLLIVHLTHNPSELTGTQAKTILDDAKIGPIINLLINLAIYYSGKPSSIGLRRNGQDKDKLNAVNRLIKQFLKLLIKECSKTVDNKLEIDYQNVLFGLKESEAYDLIKQPRSWWSPTGARELNKMDSILTEYQVGCLACSLYTCPIEPVEELRNTLSPPLNPHAK